MPFLPEQDLAEAQKLCETGNRVKVAETSYSGNMPLACQQASSKSRFWQGRTLTVWALLILWLSQEPSPDVLTMDTAPSELPQASISPNSCGAQQMEFTVARHGMLYISQSRQTHRENSPEESWFLNSCSFAQTPSVSFQSITLRS